MELSTLPQTLGSVEIFLFLNFIASAKLKTEFGFRENQDLVSHYDTWHKHFSTSKTALVTRIQFWY